MTPEDRLRRAIAARAQSVEPSDDGLDRIAEKLLDPGGDMRIPPTSTTRWYLVAAATVVIAGIAGGIALTGDDDGGQRTGDGVAGDPDTTTTEPDTTTTTTTTTTTPPVEPAADIASQAVWPRPSSSVHFDDPVEVARSWARYYAGFENPLPGDFRPGDSRSGEVPVWPKTTAYNETTVLVRQLSDDNWYVIGSTTENITVTTPSNGDQLTCPQVLQGTALAFEGTVQVHIDAYQPDGDRVEVARGIVTGGGGPEAPFDDEIACHIPDGVESYGVVHFWTGDESEQVGGPLESVTFPIRLR